MNVVPWRDDPLPEDWGENCLHLYEAYQRLRDVRVEPAGRYPNRKAGRVHRAFKDRRDAYYDLARGLPWTVFQMAARLKLEGEWTALLALSEMELETDPERDMKRAARIGIGALKRTAREGFWRPRELQRWRDYRDECLKVLDGQLS